MPDLRWLSNGHRYYLYDDIQLKYYSVMKKNMGNADRVIRILLTIIFVALYYTGTVTGWLGISLVALGVIFTLTSFSGFCPIYAITGINSCPPKKTT
ncbi:MAG TPA: DUF2892 domain-containing protein [Cyclobacteriaceae bacterium]